MKRTLDRRDWFQLYSSVLKGGQKQPLRLNQCQQFSVWSTVENSHMVAMTTGDKWREMVMCGETARAAYLAQDAPQQGPYGLAFTSELSVHIQ